MNHGGNTSGTAGTTVAKKKTASPWHYLWDLVNYVYFNVMRAIYKWFCHVYTNKSEIERVVDRFDLAPSTRIKRIEYALLHSKSAELRQVVSSCPVEAVPSVVQALIKIKCIDKKQVLRIQVPLQRSLSQLIGHSCLIKEVEWRRQTKFEEGNEEHEALLMRFWSLVKPNTPLPCRITKMWQEVGFQGDNPSTDFRGMGVLGLEQLIYLFEEHHDAAMAIFSQSLHPKIGYPFAIAGISMTSLCRDLLRQGCLANHFYNSYDRAATMDDFNYVYYHVFSLFSVIWRNSDPESVMQFNGVRERFVNDLKTYLIEENATLMSTKDNAGSVWRP